MRKLYILSTFIGLLVGILPAFIESQETPATQMAPQESPSLKSGIFIDALNLPVDLDAYFAEKEVDVVKHRQEIVSSLKTSIATWPDKEKAEADLIIKQIDSNLDYHSKVIEAKTPNLQGMCEPLSEQCSLTDVIQLYHHIKQSNNSLTVIDETLGKINHTISDMELLRAELRKEYVKLNSTAEKGILGLKIISYWTVLLTSKLEKIQETKQKEIQADIIKDLDVALENSIDHLTSSEKALSEIAAKKKIANEEWKVAQDNLRNQHLSLLKNKVENTESEKYRAQEILALEIQEAFAHLNSINFDIKESIEQTLHFKKDSNLHEVSHHLHEWEKVLSKVESKTDRWTKNTLSYFHRAFQDLNVENEEITQDQKDSYSLLTELAQKNQILLLRLSSEISDDRFLMSILRNEVAQLEGGAKAVGRQFMETLYEIAESIYDWSTISLFIIGGVTVTPIDLVKMVIIILCSMWLSRAILVALTHFSHNRTGVRKSLIYRIHRLIHYAIMTLGFFIGLSVIGFDFTSFILVAGALGVGIGFGLQTIVNNFISGIIILFESYLRIGDVIELESGKRGEILEINFRSTTIRTVDGTDLLLPNSLLIDRGVTNWTLADPYRRLHAAFSTSYGVDKEFIAKIISEGAKEVASTIMMPVKPNPVVRLTKLGDYGLEFELIVWVDEGVNARSSSSLSDYLWMIDTVLAKNKIEIPSRQLDIHLIAKKDSDLT